MATLKELQNQIADARASNDNTGQYLRFGKQSIQKTDKEIASLKRLSTAHDHANRLGELLKEKADRQQFLDEAREGWPAVQDGLLQARLPLLQRHPRSWVSELPDHTPFLLFPIKIETKFARNANGGHELWVRFFPDKIAAQSHEEVMTETEIEDGRQFWTNVADSRNLPDDEQELVAKGAWNRLVNNHGPHRSYWIAKSNRPYNFDFENEAAELQFPGFDYTKESGWVEPPCSRVMPDRFHVMAFRHDAQTDTMVLAKEALGNLVPDTMELGPDPSQLEENFKRDEETGHLTVDPGMKWMVDFDEAIKVGMGLKMPISAAEAQQGFDRLLVLGLTLSKDERESARAVEKLFEAHQYTDGMAFLPKGTPTNNTETAPSGLDSRDVGAERSFDLLLRNTQFTNWSGFTEKQHKPDGQLFAEALGLGYDPIFQIEHAEKEDAAEAFAMNKALYPATLGNYLEEWLGAAFDEKTRGQMEEFFLQNVSGRGHVPAFRVGEQPYGVLITGSVKSWVAKREAVGNDLQFHIRLAALLRAFFISWSKMGRNAKHVGDDSDFKQRLVDILGLNATSVDYFMRKALADEFYFNYYRYSGFPFHYLSPHWHVLHNEKYQQLAAMKLHNFKDLKIRDLTFFRDRKHLNGPVVDADPALPLSETNPITPYFKTETEQRNYIHWLLSASRKDLQIERFVNQAAEGVPPPRALLYMYLRQALLNELTRTSTGILRLNKIIAHRPVNPSMVNMTQAQHFADKDLWNVTMRAGGLEQDASDYAFRRYHNSPKQDFDLPPEEFALARPLKSMRTALQKLANLPTARLERLFAEHIDLCSYRLDAWVTGLFQQRLDYMRYQRAGRGNEEVVFDDFGDFNEGQMPYNRGTYIGAYGWVENLRPRAQAPKPVPESQIPEAIRSPGQTVVEDPTNGGYVLAPSLNHATASAVLLNAYLSHADRDNGSQFAVNLSSRRVRQALKIVEGLQNGQSIGALLGYQLERALHDNPNGLELDEYIYVLRDRFPFTAGKLTDVPDDGSAEVVEANNVVNGYDLLHFTKNKTYPYGLPTGGQNLPPAGTPKAVAIAGAIRQLEDTLDAVGDLATSESVYQAVQGNFDRAGGMLKALAEGTPPPSPDFIQTPRNGKVVTQRLAISLDPNAPSAAAGWGAATPRSAANAPVNAWLAAMLPGPGTVGFEAVIGNVLSFMDLTEAFDLQPVDFVLMSGEHLGDQSSELERYLVHQIKSKPGNEAEVVSIHFHKAAVGKTALSLLQPLLRSLRRVVAESRPLHGQDFMTGIDGQNTPAADPQGYAAGLNAFRARVQSLYDRVAAELDENGTGLMNFYKTTLEAPFLVFADDPDNAAPAWEGLLAQTRDRLAALVPLALPEALPASTEGFDKLKINALVGQVVSVLEIFQKRKKETDDAQLLLVPDFLLIELDEDKGTALENMVLNLGRAAKILLNESFVAVPTFLSRNAGEMKNALDPNRSPALQPGPLEVEKWLQGIARVQERAGNLATLATTRDMLLDGDFDLSPVQFPFDENGHWAGGEFPEGYSPANDTVSVMLHQAVPPDPDNPLCGLLVDEWTEVIPEKEVDAGITFHYNRPNAMPPQALLLVVPANLNGQWSYDELLDTLHETIDQAKLRAVEPNHLLRSVGFQVLPAVLTEFTQFNFSLNLKHNVLKRAGIAPDPVTF